MEKSIKIFLISVVYMFSAISMAEEIIFDSQVKVKKNDATEFVELKGQQPLELEAGDKAFVSTSEGIPFFIFSAARNNSKIEIPHSQISMVAMEQAAPFLEKTTNEIVDGLRRVDSLISKRDYAQALTKITILKEKYKGLSSVLFLSGTVNYLSNNKNAAIKDLEGGLLINPENSSAKKLLEKIKKEI